MQRRLEEARCTTVQQEVKLHQEYEQKKQEMKAELREEYGRKEQEMKREMKDSMLKLESKTSEVNRRLALEVSELQNQVSTKTKLLGEMKQEGERYAGECSAMSNSRQKIMEELEAQMKFNKDLQCDKNTIEKEKKFLETDAVRLNTELIRLQHELEKKMTATEEYKSLLSESKRSLKNANEKSTSLDREFNGMRKSMEIHKRNEVE